MNFVWAIEHTPWGTWPPKVMFFRDKAFVLRLARSYQHNGWPTEVKRVSVAAAHRMNERQNIFGLYPFEIRKVVPLASGRAYERLRARILAERGVR